MGWTQAAMFAQVPAPGTLKRAANVRHRQSATRVTRDPAVALSHAESRVVAAQIAGGLVAAFGRLSPERRDALRAIFHSVPLRQIL